MFQKKVIEQKSLILIKDKSQPDTDLDFEIDLSAQMNVSTYGTFIDDPLPEHLQAFFILTEADLELLSQRRLPHTKLGMALQICTLRFLGTFLYDPTAVPVNAIDFVRAQLGFDQVDLEPYRAMRDSRFDHRKIIRDHVATKSFKERLFSRWVVCCSSA